MDFKDPVYNEVAKNKVERLYQKLYPELQQGGNPPVGSTLDVVRFRDMHSRVAPFDVDLTSKIGNTKLPFPLFSASMDTLSGPKMAQVLSEVGGCGVLYRTKDPEKQLQWAKEVIDRKPCLVPEPMCVHPNDTLEKTWDILEEYDFSTIPVTDEDNILNGILFTRDIAYMVKNRMSESVRDWMVPFEELKVEKFKTPYAQIKNRLLNEPQCSVLPVVNEKKQFQGIYFMKDFFINMDAAMHKGKPLCGIAVNEDPQDLDRVKRALNIGVGVIVVESSHGNCPPIIEQVKKIKEITGDEATVIGGNIANIDGYIRLAEAGADAIKCGIGSGSICTTSQVTGVGVPMFSLIRELNFTKRELEKEGFPAPEIIADGGINGPGEMSVSLAAGANGCMAGKWLVGFEESISCQEGNITQDGYVHYRGMASKRSIKKRMAAGRYDKQKKAPEGVEGKVPFRGPLKQGIGEDDQGIGEDIELIQGGLAHAGAETIEEFHRIANSTPHFFIGFNQGGKQIKPNI